MLQDPYLAFYADLTKHDGAAFMSDDAYGHLCTVTDAVWTPQGRSFDINHDDEISIPDSTDWNIASYDFTWSLWVKHSEIDAVSFYISQAIDNDYYWLFRKQADNTLVATYKNTAAERIDISGATTLSVDTCYFVTLKKSGTTWTIHINANSTPDGTTTKAVAGGDFAHALLIGSGADLDVANNIYGVIGELTYHTRALSAGELAQQYESTKWRYV